MDGATAPRIELSGHTHVPLDGEQETGKTGPDTEVRATLILRRRNDLPKLHAVLGSKLPHERDHLTHGEFSERHGASSEDVALVKEFASRYGLDVDEVDEGRRTVQVRGSAAEVERAFGVELVEVEHRRGRYRAARGGASLPGELSGVVKSVLGLQTRPCAQRKRVHHENATEPYWTARELAAAYGFPELSAAGQRIALIELGGGYREEDIQKLFAGLNRMAPTVRCVAVDGVGNSPATVEQIQQFLEVVKGKRKPSEVAEDALAAAQATVEVTMDIEIAAALAPGAEIVVYMAPNTEQGIYDAVSMALRDKDALPCALSISWGEPETGVSAAYLTAVDEVLRDAAMLGVTVCASSGDDGAMNGATDGKPVVNFPASSPHALSCGGSTVRAAQGENMREAAWNCTLHGLHGATGGGVSRHFELPVWQKPHGVPLGPTGIAGRGVPDVAGPADPHRGCAIVVGGEVCSSAGTSAVAPLWAALVACINAATDARCGYLTPLLYLLAENDASLLRPITEGNNGYYEAGLGWDACTGLGSPMVGRLIQALRKEKDSTIEGIS